MWEEASKTIKSVFYKDEITLYELEFSENEIGEDIEQLKLIGSYQCNIENGQSENSQKESGETSPQILRISTEKNIPLNYEKTYKIKISKARINFDSNEEFKVNGWTEALISTVISVSREVAI